MKPVKDSSKKQATEPKEPVAKSKEPGLKKPIDEVGSPKKPEKKFLTGQEANALNTLIDLTNRSLKAGVIKDIGKSNRISQSLKIFDVLIRRLEEAEK